MFTKHVNSHCKIKKWKLFFINKIRQMEKYVRARRNHRTFYQLHWSLKVYERCPMNTIFSIIYTIPYTFLHADFIWHSRYGLTNSLEQSFSWESCSFSASPEFLRLLWDQRIYYCANMSLHLVQKSEPDKLSWSFPSYLFKAHVNLNPHLSLGLPSNFSFTFYIKSLYVFSFSNADHVSLSAHLLLFDHPR
jgi:hypothetical protein